MAVACGPEQTPPSPLAGGWRPRLSSHNGLLSCLGSLFVYVSVFLSCWLCFCSVFSFALPPPPLHAPAAWKARRLSSSSLIAMAAALRESVGPLDGAACLEAGSLARRFVRSFLLPRQIPCQRGPLPEGSSSRVRNAHMQQNVTLAGGDPAGRQTPHEGEPLRKGSPSGRGIRAWRWRWR